MGNKCWQLGLATECLEEPAFVQPRIKTWRPPCSKVIPLFGARQLTKPANKVVSLDSTFSPEQFHRHDKASAVALGFLQDFAESQMVGPFDFDRVYTLTQS